MRNNNESADTNAANTRLLPACKAQCEGGSSEDCQILRSSAPRLCRWGPFECVEVSGAAPWGGCVVGGSAGSASGAHSTDTGGTGPACWYRLAHSCGTYKHEGNSILSLMHLKSGSSMNLSQDYIFAHAICTNNATIIDMICRSLIDLLPTCREPVEGSHQFPASKRASSPPGSPGLWCKDGGFSCNVKNHESKNTFHICLEKSVVFLG